MNRSTPPTSLAIDAQTLNAVATLTIQVRRVVEGIQGGTHISPHFGASVEFAEHKKYTPGDDLRDIDWRALARTDRYFVKQHQREVVLRCLLVLDCSASMSYRGERARATKLNYARVLLGAMAHILVRQGDAAGLLTFADRIIDFFPPKRRPDHLPAIMSRLAGVRTAVSSGTRFTEAISRAADGIGRRAMVVMASDLWGADRDAELALTRLAARGHDVAIFHVLDPDELDLPFEQPVMFHGLEGEPSVEADPTMLRADYRKEVRAVQDHWRHLCGKSGIDLHTAISNAPPEFVLANFAASRHTHQR